MIPARAAAGPACVGLRGDAASFDVSEFRSGSAGLDGRFGVDGAESCAPPS